MPELPPDPRKRMELRLQDLLQRRREIETELAKAEEELRFLQSMDGSAIPAEGSHAAVSVTRL